MSAPLTELDLFTAVPVPLLDSNAAAPSESQDARPISLASFAPNRILSESTASGSVYVLGTLDGEDTIVHLQKTLMDWGGGAAPTTTTTTAGAEGDDGEGAAEDKRLGGVGGIVRALERMDVFLENQPYFSAHAWLPTHLDRAPDLAVKIIRPATETHIKKYSAQARYIVTESREVYDTVVRQYMDGFDESRLGWVYAILEGRKEAERVLYRTEGEEGFVILPDLKWDQTSMAALYLTVLVQTRSIRSLRDLTRAHIPLLNSIKQATFDTVRQKYGVSSNKLRLFVHYQPSYYHFHVHVVHIGHEAFAGMLVGQAHMLEDLITLLELSHPDGPSILAQKSYTYPLGEEHGLFKGMKDAGVIILDDIDS